MLRARPPAPHDLRHRGAAPPLRGRGHRVRLPAERHLRLRPLRPRALGKLFVVRDPLGVKPVVYAERREPPGVRLRGEGRAGQRPGARRARRGEPAPLDERPLRARRAHALPRHPAAAARPRPRGRPTRARASTRTPTIDWTPDEPAAPPRLDSKGSASHYEERGDQRQLLSDVPARRVALRRHRLELDRRDDPPAATAAPIKTFSLGFDEPTDELDDARFVAETYETEHHEMVLHRAGAPVPRRRDPLRGAAEGQLAAALPAAPLHRRARDGGALRARRRRAVRRLRHLRLPRPHRSGSAPGCAGDGAPRGLARRSTGRRRPSWRGARPAAARPRRPASSSGSPPPTTGAATTCCCATPGTSTRQLAAPRVHARVRRPARDREPRATSTSTSTATRPSRPRCCGRSSPRRWSSDLLHNEDTMSMAHSVESRVPLLDLELVRFAARIPDDAPLRAGHEGPAEGGAARRAPGPGAGQEEVGLHVQPRRAVPEGPRPDGPGAAHARPARPRAACSTRSSCAACSTPRRTNGSAGTTSCCGR